MLPGSERVEATGETLASAPCRDNEPLAPGVSTRPASRGGAGPPSSENARLGRGNDDTP
jgi:hypothetical protein